MTGPEGFWLVLLAILVAITLYTIWRIKRRSAPVLEKAGPYIKILPISSPVAVEAAQELSQAKAKCSNGDVEDDA